MVIARDQITLSWQLDVQGTVYYYKKQSSTATAPEKPTSYPPTGWTTTEPGYSSGETSTLYVTVCTLYDNGSFEYSDVSVSASFEAAKEAYNKAVAAQTAANNAITAANGKTKIFYQDDAPTAGMAVGDMWFDTDGGNAVYQYTSTGWVLRQFGNGSIAAGSITANEIYGQYLSAIFANLGEITAGILRSWDYQAPASGSNYSTRGMIIDLNDKVIRTPKTAILSDGSIYSSSVDLTGKITASEGSIGPWDISSYGLRNDASTTEYFHLDVSSIDARTANGRIYITPGGNITSTDYTTSASSSLVWTLTKPSAGRSAAISYNSISLHYSGHAEDLGYIYLGKGTNDVYGATLHLSRSDDAGSLDYLWDRNLLKLTGGRIWIKGTSTEQGYIHIESPTSASNNYSSTNPYLQFSNEDATESIKLIFTDYDSVQSPSSLTLVGNSGGAYFIAQNIKATSGLYIGTADVSDAVKSITRSGTTFTATRLDGTTFTFTQQDNNSVTGVKGNAETSYRTGNVNLTPANIGALALTGGTLSGSVLISATGKGYNLKDASGTSYGGLYENGDNLWIGAASSTSPHHRGTNGNTYISAGYNTTNNAGNGTIYISVPSLSGSTWSHTPYAVLHSGNYSSYALPKSGGTLTGSLTINGNLTFANTSDLGIVQGYNSTTKYNILRNHGNGNVSLSACSAGLYLGYEQTTFVNFLNGKMSLNSQGHLTVTGEVHAGGKGTASDGKAGSILSTAGHLYMQGASGSHIYFYYGTSTTVTSQLYESASGTIRVSGDFTVDGVIRVPKTWANTTTNSANVRVIDQYGQLQRYTSSSKRYKHGIKQIENYKDVLDINVVNFVYNKDYLSENDPRYGTPIPGFIAEDVAEKYPIAADVIGGKVEDWNARYIIPPMLAVEQDHEKRIAALENENADLRAEIAKLKGAA